QLARRGALPCALLLGHSKSSPTPPHNAKHTAYHALMDPRLLRVANGESGTTTLEAAGVPGTMSIWADPLHDGPVPGGLDDDALLEVRRKYHAPSTAAADPKNDVQPSRR